MAGKKKPIQMNANYRKSELLLETGQIDVPGSGGEGKIYEGIAPIQVDNTNDEIGIDLTNIQAKLTAGQNITIDENNVISASGGEGHEYTGVAPIVVDNTNETVGVTMDSVPTAGSSNPVTSDGINQTNNALATALQQYVDNQVSGKADKNKFNTVAGYQVYTEGTPTSIPVAIDSTVVHNTGEETVNGNKTLTGITVFRNVNTDFYRNNDFHRVRLVRDGLSSPTTEVIGAIRYTDLANSKDIQLIGKYIDANNMGLYVQDINNGSSRTFRIEPGGGTTPAGLIKQVLNVSTPKDTTFVFSSGQIYMTYLKNISSYGISVANWTTAISGTINPTFEDKYFASVIGHFRGNGEITTMGGYGVVGHYAMEGEYNAEVSVYFQGVEAWNNANKDTVIATIEITVYNGASQKIKQINVTRNNFSNYFIWFKVYDITT